MFAADLVIMDYKFANATAVICVLINLCCDAVNGVIFIFIVNLLSIRILLYCKQNMKNMKF